MSLLSYYRLNSEKAIVIDVLNHKAAVLFVETGKQGPWHEFKPGEHEPQTIVARGGSAYVVDGHDGYRIPCIRPME